MQLTPREVVVQFAHLLQQDLFPHIATAIGPLSAELELLTAVMTMSPVERFISARRAGIGRPAKDRAAGVRARLLSGGLPFITTNSRMRERFSEYLQTAPAAEYIRCVSRVGWAGDSFVLPDMVIGSEQGEKLLYQPASDSAQHYWHAKGTVREWRDNTSPSSDVEAAVEQLRAFLEKYGSSRIQTINPRSANVGDAPRTVNRAGFLRSSGEEAEYLIFKDTFRTEICCGFDYRAVAKELGRRGFLFRQDHSMTIKARIPELGSPTRVYCIRAAILEGECHPKSHGTSWDRWDKA